MNPSKIVRFLTILFFLGSIAAYVACRAGWRGRSEQGPPPNFIYLDTEYTAEDSARAEPFLFYGTKAPPPDPASYRRLLDSLKWQAWVDTLSKNMLMESSKSGRMWQYAPADTTKNKN